VVTRRQSMSLIGGLALGVSGAASFGSQGSARKYTDPLYTQPFIDVDEWRNEPERHRYVHGGFTGTPLKFSMYFPPAEKYQGRFFHPVMHISGNENAARGRLAGLDGDSIGFAFDSGGYLVESNMGWLAMRGPGDITGFRASAATAEYSRELATKMYGGGRPYGYVYGGSGGGFKSMACVENTSGVWDGAVPFIHGSPVSLPNAFTVQAHALRILDGKFDGIVDAISPGGSGDMYAGLNNEERAALQEVTRMGFPPRAWFAHERLSVNYTGVLASIIVDLLRGDPGYFDDFWKKPGYLGFEPTASLKRAHIQYRTAIAGILTTAQAQERGLPVSIAAGTKAAAPSAINLASLPQARMQGAYLTLKSGAAAGRRMMVTGIVGDVVLIGFDDADIATLQTMRNGDEVEVDNSIYLATQTFHRHQNPPREYYVWDEFRKPDGSLIYPERPLLANSVDIGPGYASQSGKFSCKMIVIENLMDEAAYPWQADWYRAKVRAALGARVDDQYRLWFTDHAMHVNPGSYMTPSEGGPTTTTQSSVDTHIISYAGILQQALRDVAAWAERGIAPPQSTNYRVEDGQIVVPSNAAERGGIQPVVTLTVNGKQRADVRVGQSVTLEAVAATPPRAGFIVSAEWDFDGSGAYPEHSDIKPQAELRLGITHTFQKPGTYFPVVRVTSHRSGDAGTRYALAHNLARVRVVVSA
jgi:hypothetical protein